PAPPVPDAPVRAADAVDSAGAGQAMEAVRHAEALLEALSADPAPGLKSGGLGVRDLRRLARGLGLPENSTAVLVEVTSAAGLLGETDGEYGGEPAFLPTAGYDAWRGRSIASRWTALARAWLTMPRQPSLVGRRAAARRDPDADPLGVLSAAGPVGSAAVAALDKLVPPPVDHVLIQADLTVVVPGPPAPDLAGELALTAEPESANVYRITADSIRGALDAGYLPADLHGLFARRSRTPVPQALTYLVDDVARRHGGMRVGSAGAYLRSEDESLLAELIADRR